MNRSRNYFVVVLALALVSFGSSVKADVDVTFVAASSPASNLVVGNQWMPMGMFNLDNTDMSPVTVTEVKLDTGPAAAIMNATIYGTNIYATPVMSGSSSIADFHGLNIQIPGNSSVNIRADVNIAPVDDVVGVPNGTKLAIALDTPNDITYEEQGSAIYATGHVTANQMELVKSRPYVTLDKYSPHGDTLVPAANQLAASFDVSADPGANLIFAHSLSSSITFDIAGYKASDDGLSKTWSLETGSMMLVSTATVSSNDSSVTFNFRPYDLVLAAGQESILSVYADMSGYSHQGDWLQLSLSDRSDSLIYSVDGSLVNSAPLAVGNYVGGIDAGVISNGQAVPEPSTFVLLGVGALGLVIACWRKRRS